MATAATAAGAESTRAEQIISNFYLKALHIILHSRIPHLVQRPRDPRPTKRDRWFNLAVGDHPAVVETLNFWTRGGGGSDPMVVDVVLSGPSDRDSVLERWVVEYIRGGGSGADVYAMYKKGIVLLRSMYSMLRLLPAYKAFRMLSSSNQNYSFSLTYKVSSFAEPFDRAQEEEMKQHCFGSVETQFGQIGVSVAYRRSLKEFDLEGSPLMLPRIISDYVGSPAADPLRAFPSSLRASSSFPLRDPELGAVQSTRPHSWTSPPMKHHPLAQASEQNASPPTKFAGRQCLAAHHLHRTTSSGSRKGGIDIFNENKLSPPFSPSPTPSPPMHPNSPLRSRMQSETAPVNIPLPSRSSLPPPSPRHTRANPASGESPSEGRSYRKIEGFQIGDLHSNSTASPSSKGVRDGKDDVGHFSGIFSSCGSPRIGFSRSSSRLSSQDFADDSELFCHFALDDIDTSDSQNRNADGKEALGSSQPYISSRKSQDAAVGVLVQTLRSAPPLRQDSTYSSQSTKSELGGDIGSSSFFMSRKTSDALEELRSYKEMKDMLLSRSGTESLDLSRQTQK